MPTLQQTYDAPGARYRIVGDPDDVVSPWQTHRMRLRKTISGLAGDDWQHPTRCTNWDASALVDHLTDVTFFTTVALGAARNGKPTRYLEGFDPARPSGEKSAAPTSPLDGAELIERFIAADDELDRLLVEMSDADWAADAEAPPGLVPARLTLNHMLFDSWVHERDLLVPREEEPRRDTDEVAATLRYVMAMCGLWLVAAEDASVVLDVKVSSPDLHAILWIDDGWAVAEIEPATVPSGSVVTVTGDAADVIDHTTGRVPRGQLGGDAAGAQILTRLASVLAR